jgi:3-methyladenine DNA glycosylase AlkD
MGGMKMQYQEIIQKLHLLADPEAVAGMARYGINSTNNLGISIYKLRPLAKEIGKNHNLALKLWDSGIHDARLLAVFVDDPTLVTSEQMDAWALDFDSWDICDQACTSLFDTTVFAWTKAFEWAKRNEEFVRRGAFSLIAGLSVHDTQAENKKFERFFPIIIQHAVDNRNYVKKAVNWALRNIGKRNTVLHKKALDLAYEIKQIDSQAARWIAADAIRELSSDKVKIRSLPTNR